MRLGTCLLIGGHTPQGALHKLADFCSAPVAGFYSAVDTNQTEALMLWVPVAVLAVAVAPEKSHVHVPLIAIIFLIARPAYAAVSLAGIPLLRSLAWIVGFAAWVYLTWIVLGVFAS